MEKPVFESEEKRAKRIKNYENLHKIFCVMVLCGFIIMGYGGGCLIQTANTYNDFLELGVIDTLINSFSQQTFIHIDSVKDMINMTINFNDSIINSYSLLIGGFILILMCELFLHENNTMIYKLKRKKH